MKKTFKEFEDKSPSTLEKESVDLRKEIATMILNIQVNPQKDTNTLVKKKKRLAVLLTVMRQKQMAEKTSKKIT